MDQSANTQNRVPQYLQDFDELEPQEVERIKEQEIERINSGTVEQVFGDNFCLQLAEDREIAYKALVRYIHPDRQPDSRKEAATLAQQSKFSGT